MSGHGKGQTSRDQSSCLVWERGGSKTCNLILKPQSLRQTGESRSAWPDTACRDSFWEILSVWLWEPGTDQGLTTYLLNRVSLCLSDLVSYSSPLCSFCSRHMASSSSSNKLILKKKGLHVRCNFCSVCSEGLTGLLFLCCQVSAQMSPPWRRSSCLDGLKKPDPSLTKHCCVFFMFALILGISWLTWERSTGLSLLQGELQRTKLFCLPWLYSQHLVWHIVSLHQHGLNEWPANRLPDVSTLFPSANHCEVGSEKCPHINSFHRTLIFFFFFQEGSFQWIRSIYHRVTPCY